MKGVVKSGSGATIKALSYLLPTGFLFSSFLLLRRFDLRLKRSAAPTAVLKAVDHLFYSLRPAAVETHLGDAKFFIRLNDPCHYDQLLGLHEPAVVEWLSTHVKSGMTVFDVGANIGFYTLLTARLVGALGRVVAVEADPGVVAILRQNIRFNALRNVHIVDGAAYRADCQVKLGRAVASSWYTGLYYGKAAEWIEVPAHTLDSVVRQLALQRVDIVKIDVEGAEGEVLQGMDRILREDRPRLLVEVHRFHAAGDVHPAIQHLKKAGYSVRYLTQDHVVADPVEIRS